MKRLVPVILVMIALSMASCQKRYAIEERARQQILVSMEDELESFSPGKTDWTIEDLKTVYVNDSICLLQCTARFLDANGEKKVRDYRYIYLFDTEMSRMLGQMIFKEEFRNILCLPDRLIKKCRRDVAMNNENVYQSSFGSCLTVRNPYDKKK
ncbi:MAG: hypothetical protein IKI00_05550 [Bacteroidales bacterium]|nr:hypothetical protein [Bacteroidales bacterium]